MSLPEHLQDIDRVYVDEAVTGSPMAERVRSRLPGAEWVQLPDGADTPKHPGPGQALYLKRYRGRFLRYCPGTTNYHCCAYRIIHVGENCPLSCSYCILQAYFQDRLMKVWANQDDLFAELDAAFSKDRNKRFRVGTGEFTDSLALEPVTGYARDLVEFLNDHSNVCLELKSKFIDLTWMDVATRTDRVLPAWSLNAPAIHESEERGTTPLENRLAAARTASEAGFRVCLHFDPMIRYPGWERGYMEIADMIFDYIKPEAIAYLSMGSFRHMPPLKPIIEENHPSARYVYEEYVPGLDGKMRLIRPLRVAQFKLLADRLRGHGLRDEQMYFCMESDEVWQAVFGTTPGAFGGLAGRLLDRAFGTVAG